MKPYFDDGKGHVIYHGDCREILPTLGKFDLCLTDPPYGLGDRMKGGTWGNSEKYDVMRTWDQAADQKICDLALSFPKSIIWGANYFKVPASRCWLIWEKSNAVPTMADFEMAYTNFDKPAKRYKGQVAQHSHNHPTQKPIGLFKWCLSFADIGDKIIDICVGSGTTLVAAKECGFEATGIELNERYCEIAAKRLEQEVFDFA